MKFDFERRIEYGLILVLALILAAAVSACSTSSPTTTPARTTSAAAPATTIQSTTTPRTQPPSASPSATAANPATSNPATPAASATSSAPKQWSTPPAMQIDTTGTYFATVDTSLGSFKIQLFASESPKTVNNFVFLSQQGFYNGVIFHRIIKQFMIQTGDPTGTGGGGPGYKFADELPVKHPYDPGIVAMANAGPNTNGSQFFVCTGVNAAGLNSQPNYTQFGKVVEGMDVVQKIAAVPVGPGNQGETSRPVTPPVINKIVISSQ